MNLRLFFKIIKVDDLETHDDENNDNMLDDLTHNCKQGAILCDFLAYLIRIISAAAHFSEDFL